MFLDATTKSLEIKLGGAVTTNQLPVAVSYVDISQSTFSVTAMSSTDTQSNGTTAVTIVAAPGATTTRVPKRIWIRNADTVSATVTVQLNNNATLRPEVVFTLLTGETLIYEDAAGWMAFDVNGNRKEVTSSVFSSLTVMGNETVGGTLGVTGTSTLARADTTILTESAGLAWTAYTPTISADTGSFTGTTTNARYRVLGKTLLIGLGVTNTGVTGSPTQMRISMPGSFTCASSLFPSLTRLTNNGSIVTGYFDPSAGNTYGYVSLDSGGAFVGISGMSGMYLIEVQ